MIEPVAIELIGGQGASAAGGKQRVIPDRRGGEKAQSPKKSSAPLHCRQKPPRASRD